MSKDTKGNGALRQADRMVADIDIRRIIDGKTYTNLTKNTPT